MNAINSINVILNSSTLMYGQSLNELRLLANKYSVDALKMAIAQSSLNAEQIKAILTAKGLTEKEIQEIIATNALTASQTGATASTLGLGTAFKGLGISIKNATKAMLAWMVTNPIGWLTAVISAIGASIYGVVKLHDALTVSLEEQKEKLQETKEAYENVKNELEDVENELQNTQNKIEELENTPNLSWVDQEELDRLREVTKELELQKQLKHDSQLEAAESLYKENEKTFNKEFESSYGNTSITDLKEQLMYGNIGIGQLDFDNMTDIITAIQYINEEKNKLTNESEIAEYNEFINDLTNSLKSNGQEYLTSLSEYKQNILEIASIRDLTDDEQVFYDYLSSMQKAIYEYYSPSTWNELEFSSVFNTKDIEKTKEELIEMYKAGELSSEEALKQYPKLYEAIKQSELIAGEGSNSVKEFYNEIAALADKQADAVNNIIDETKVSLSANEMVDQLNTRLKPAFDKLGSAYQDIFTTDGFDLDVVDIPMLEDLRSALEDLNEAEDLDINIDMGAFDDFSKILTDANTTEEEAQQVFDNLATSLFYATSATEGMSEETIKLVEQLLESLGVTNAEEVAIYALKDAKAQAILAAYDLTDATRESFVALLDEGEAANLTRQEIYNLTAAEIAFGQNTLSTEQKIEQLHNLATAYGDTASAALATAIANDLASGHTDVDSAINDLMAKINNGVQKVNLDFTSKPKSSKSKKKEKDTTEPFDWIEQAIENVEKKVKNLDDVVNSAYSTFSQKNEALAQEIEKVNEDIELQQQAYEKYMQKADSIALSDEYKVLVRDGAINIENISDEKLKTAISDYQKWYDKAVSVSDAITDLKEQLKDLHVTGYELNSDRLKELLDSESITQKQYIEEMTKLYEQFYENQTEYAVQAHEAKLALLEEEKSYLNSVANAAASLLDKEIDKVQDNAKEQEKIYQKQIDILNEKKKPLEDELDALEDKAKKEDLILGLQEKQYNLKRLENQRDNLLYKDDQLIYTADDAKIRDAQKDVDDAKLELQKYDIQKQIDAIDDEIDHINDLIDKVNEAADNQIDALEKIKNKWQEVIDQQEEAQNIILLTGEFGTNAIEKILSGNDDDLLTQWKNSYINTLTEIDLESQGSIGNITQQIASLYGVDLSPLQSQFQGVSDTVNDMTSALGEAARAVGIDDTQGNTNSNQNVSTPSTSTDISLEKAIKNETETAMESFDQHTDKLINEVIPAIQLAAEEINRFNEAADMDIEKTVTIHYETTGNKAPQESVNISGKAHAEGTVGSAFANGTKNKGLAQNEKNALRSEYGQTEMTVYPNGTYEITNEPVVSDLPKGTVIYNEEQTKEILENKNAITGNVQSGETTKEEHKFLFGNKMYTDAEFDEVAQKFREMIGQVNPAYIHAQEEMEKRLKVIETGVVNNNNHRVVIEQTINASFPNVTNETGFETFKRQLVGMQNDALQRAYTR